MNLSYNYLYKVFKNIESIIEEKDKEIERLNNIITDIKEELKKLSK